MIALPVVGGEYWIIIDIWETELTAPVTLISDDGGTFTARWYLGEGFTDDYSGLAPGDLFSCEAETWAAIRSKGGMRVE